jgi:hypothetical protein
VGKWISIPPASTATVWLVGDLLAANLSAALRPLYRRADVYIDICANNLRDTEVFSTTAEDTRLSW